MKNVFVSTVICLAMVLATGLTKAVKKCVEPTSFNDFSFEQFINLTIVQSYSITPGWYQDMEAADKVPSEYIAVSFTHFLGNIKCKKQKKKKENTLYNLSQCMWRYVENTDKNRKPETLLEVDCVCARPFYARKKDKLVCQSVIEYVNVFRKVGCVNGVFEYKRVWEPRSVACVASTLPEPKRLYTIDYKTTI